MDRSLLRKWIPHRNLDFVTWLDRLGSPARVASSYAAVVRSLISWFGWSAADPVIAVPAGLEHGSILPTSGACINPGAVHEPFRRDR